MSATTLKALIGPRSGGSAVLSALRQHLAPGLCIVDASGRCLLGDASASSNEPHRTPVLHEDVILGYVIGTSSSASAIASLLAHLASRDSENRARGSEVLHLYREIHLIEELSEQLAPPSRHRSCCSFRSGPSKETHYCDTRKHSGSGERRLPALHRRIVRRFVR